MRVTIPCTRCGRYLHLDWDEWLNRWPVVCRACQTGQTKA